MADFDPERIYQIERPDPKLLTLYIIRAVLSLVFFPIVFLPMYFKYKTLHYRFDDEGVTMSWGLLWKQEIFLTYARIQDIHLQRGLIERWLGLATIDIQTASGAGAAEMSIVGLLEYEQIRDFLYSRMRGARFGEPTGAAQDQPAVAEDSLAGLLGEIRDELRALRSELEARR